MNFDPKCYDLAEYFMPSDSAEHREALAEHIQGCIEDWLIGFSQVPGPTLEGPAQEAHVHKPSCKSRIRSVYKLSQPCDCGLVSR